MAYDERLAARVRTSLLDQPAVDQIKMFGGICFKVDGYMACGVLEDALIVKCDADDYDEHLEKPHTRPFDFTGRPLRGIFAVDPAGVRTAAALRKWLAIGIAAAKAKASAPISRRRKKAKSRSWPRKLRRIS